MSPSTSVINISPQEASRLVSQHLSKTMPQLLQDKPDPLSKLWTQRFTNRLDLPWALQMQLEVVQPNDFWQKQSRQGQGASTTSTDPAQQTPSRVCWTGRYNLGTPYYEVWADAETGEVVGGAEASFTTH